jgi:hypothetical protein
MRGGMVAENSVVCRVVGVAWRIRSRSAGPVEHLVGFIEHEHEKSFEHQRLPTEVVEGSARRRHDDVGAPIECARLLLHGGAAVDRNDAEARAAPVLVQGLGDLHRQLARWHKHEPARAVSSSRLLHEALNEREREGRVSALRPARASRGQV